MVRKAMEYNPKGAVRFTLNMVFQHTESYKMFQLEKNAPESRSDRRNINDTGSVERKKKMEHLTVIRFRNRLRRRRMVFPITNVRIILYVNTTKSKE